MQMRKFICVVLISLIGLIGCVGANGSHKSDSREGTLYEGTGIESPSCEL